MRIRLNPVITDWPTASWFGLSQGGSHDWRAETLAEARASALRQASRTHHDRWVWRVVITEERYVATYVNGALEWEAPVRITPIGVLRRPCEHAIHPGSPDTWAGRASRRYREERRVPVDVCARPSTHLVDGRPMCRNHAGAEALRIMTESE